MLRKTFLIMTWFPLMFKLLIVLTLALIPVRRLLYFSLFVADYNLKGAGNENVPRKEGEKNDKQV